MKLSNIFGILKPLLKPWLLALGILAFGTMNTMMGKFQNMQSFKCDESYKCEACTEDDVDCIDWEQPFFQSLFLFIGESTCAVMFAILFLHRKGQELRTGVKIERSKLKGFRYLIFFLPAILDVLGTSLMNLGLVYTTASVYQMLRGTVVIFTGACAVLLLKRKHFAFHWIGLVLVSMGLATVGLASILMNEPSSAAKNPLLGDLLVVAAQLLQALQMVAEEKFLGHYEVHPLQVVGYEGLSGIAILLVLLPILQFTAGQAGEMGNIFDIRFAFAALTQSPAILTTSLLFIISYCATNLCGVWTTKILGATARTTIEQCRILIVWTIGLSIGWENFLWPQLIGFFLLVIGTFLYNRVIQSKCFRYPQEGAVAEETHVRSIQLIDDEDEDEDEEIVPLRLGSFDDDGFPIAWRDSDQEDRPSLDPDEKDKGSAS